MCNAVRWINSTMNLLLICSYCNQNFETAILGMLCFYSKAGLTFKNSLNIAELWVPAHFGHNSWACWHSSSFAVWYYNLYGKPLTGFCKREKERERTSCFAHNTCTMIYEQLFHRTEFL